MLDRVFQTLGRTFEDLRKNKRLGRVFKKAACLCYNMDDSVPISHGISKKTKTK